MSFSTNTKEELTRVSCQGYEERLAELAGFCRLAGSIQIKGYKKMNLKLITELNSIARAVFKLLKDCFDISAEITVNRNQQLKRNNSYVITVTSEMGSEMVMKTLGMLEKTEGFFPKEDLPEDLILTDAQKGAYLRGAFLGGGSVSDPEKNYHMEFVTGSSAFANSLVELINSFELNSKSVVRRGCHVVYLKESEQISDLLNIIGAHSALLNLQNIKVMKSMRNNINRIVNCETANLSKTANAAVRQVDSINLIQNTIGITKLPVNLQEIALLRLEYEESSLKELGEMMNPPLGKSGVNHRLKKIEEIAQRIRENK